MKRLLVVLLALGLSVPAMAQSTDVNAFVYNLKQSGVEFEYDSGTSAWVKSPKSNHTFYVVVEVDGSAPTSINLWSVETWKEKDAGVTTNYYTKEGPSDINFIETPIANKMMWIASGDVGNNTLIMVSGQAKLKKIGTTTYTVAATMSGYAIFGDIEPDEDIGGNTVSLTLNPKITTALVAQVLIDSGDVDSAISDYLEGLGYVFSPD